MAISLLGETEYRINDKVTVLIPTLGEYRDKKKRDQYDSLMSLFMTTPSNYMLQLHKLGRDFRKIDEYTFFLELFYGEYFLSEKEKSDSTIMFKGIDFSKLHFGEDNNKTVLVDDNGDVVIDEYAYIQIGLLIAELFNTSKYRKNPANDIAYEYFLELEEEHQRNAKRIKRKNQNEFDELIVALVCNQGFPYTFKTVNELTVYDFYCCVKQIIKNTNYQNLMRGVYSGFGSVDIKKIKKSELNYLSFR